MLGGEGGSWQGIVMRTNNPSCIIPYSLHSLVFLGRLQIRCMSRGFFTFSQPGLKCTHDKHKKLLQNTNKEICVRVCVCEIWWVFLFFCGRPASGAGEYLSSFYCLVFFFWCVSVWLDSDSWSWRYCLPMMHKEYLPVADCRADVGRVVIFAASSNDSLSLNYICSRRLLICKRRKFVLSFLNMLHNDGVCLSELVMVIALY